MDKYEELKEAVRKYLEIMDDDGLLYPDDDNWSAALDKQREYLRNLIS